MNKSLIHVPSCQGRAIITFCPCSSTGSMELSDTIFKSFLKSLIQTRSRTEYDSCIYTIKRNFISVSDKMKINSFDARTNYHPHEQTYPILSRQQQQQHQSAFESISATNTFTYHKMFCNAFVEQRIIGTCQNIYPNRTTHSMKLHATTKRYISSIGFSGCGFLVPYQIGVVKALQDHKLLPLPINYKNNDTNTNNYTVPSLIGCSGGALTAAAISIGVSCDDAMDTCININNEIQQKQLLFDVLHPGFSLLDTIESHFQQLLINAIDTIWDGDFNYYLQSTTGSSTNNNNKQHLLRIGLTDRRYVIPPGNRTAFYYVQKYRSIDDIIASCILSSYIPGITGPVAGTNNATSINATITNTSILRASSIINDMLDNNCIYHNISGKVVSRQDFDSTTGTGTSTNIEIPMNVNIGNYWKNVLQRQYTTITTEPTATTTATTNNSNTSNTTTTNVSSLTIPSVSVPMGGTELFWDGGLSDGFPYYDTNTLMVSPVSVTFPNHLFSITPAIEATLSNTGTTTTTTTSRPRQQQQQLFIDINPDVRVHTSSDNIRTVRQIIFSSNNTILEQKFQQGYDNASQFIKQNNNK